MFGASVSTSSMQSFDFSMKTSSGDKISLSMYNGKDTEFSEKRDQGLHEMSLSIRETYGYSFSYEGNGIDEQDKKEIAEALKKIEPLLNIFQKRDGGMDHKQATNLAFDMKNLLPEPKNENHKNFIKDATLTKMDDMLKAFDAVDEMRELAKNVFDMLEKQMESLQVYA